MKIIQNQYALKKTILVVGIRNLKYFKISNDFLL